MPTYGEEKLIQDTGKMKDMLPFIERKIEEEEVFIREFSQSTDSEEFAWHRDREDRVISSVLESDWMFQLENCTPTRINGAIQVQAGTWHRLIKGSGDLTLKIIKK